MIRKRDYPGNIKPEFIKISKKDNETLRGMGLYIPKAGETELSSLVDVLSHYNSGELFPCDYGFSKPFIKRPHDDKTKSGLDWWIVEFAPYSKEGNPQGYNTLYKTREDCITGAIKYLGERGYDAKSIDLIGIIDNL
jgi:methylthioribose-1-phosphate isomerase